MRRIDLATATVLLLLLSVGLTGCVGPDGLGDAASPVGPLGRTGHPLEGMPAPAYAAATLDGDMDALADHAGRPVLLHVWASWCTVCEGEEPELARLWDEYGDRVDFYLISIDDERTQDAMRAEAAEWPFGSLWDPEDAVRPTFQVSYQPVTVFVAADGTIDAVWQGQRADRTTLRGEPELARVVLDRLVAQA